ncbi:MAG: hypothetical protein J7K21_01680 [Desulfurococcales archaeon]|nr:hypothetical protein [Desulfurococcales archaeon]
MTAKPGIYIKHGDTWILVKGKISRTVVSRSRKKTIQTYSMIGESVEEEPVGKNNTGTFYVSAFGVTKYIQRILDIHDGKSIVRIEPFKTDTYKVIVYNASNKFFNELKEVASELKVLRTRAEKKTSIKTKQCST